MIVYCVTVSVKNEHIDDFIQAGRRAYEAGFDAYVGVGRGAAVQV